MLLISQIYLLLLKPTFPSPGNTYSKILTPDIKNTVKGNFTTEKL